MSADKGGRPRAGTMVTSRPCSCTSIARVLDTRRRNDGTHVRRMICETCLSRWTIVGRNVRRKVAIFASFCAEVEVEMRKHESAVPAEIAAWMESNPCRVRRALEVLCKDGKVGRVPAEGRGGGGRSLWRYFIAGAKPPEPKSQPARYVGAIVPARPSGVMSAERIEMRKIGGRLVKVTILPSAIESDPVHLPSVPRVRVNLSSQWGVRCDQAETP